MDCAQSRDRREPILVVPSALAPDEFNWRLNPDHPDQTRTRPRAGTVLPSVLCLIGVAVP